MPTFVGPNDIFLLLCTYLLLRKLIDFSFTIWQIKWKYIPIELEGTFIRFPSLFLFQWAILFAIICLRILRSSTGYSIYFFIWNFLSNLIFSIFLLQRTPIFPNQIFSPFSLYNGSGLMQNLHNLLLIFFQILTFFASSIRFLWFIIMSSKESWWLIRFHFWKTIIFSRWQSMWIYRLLSNFPTTFCFNIIRRS